LSQGLGTCVLEKTNRNGFVLICQAA